MNDEEKQQPVIPEDDESVQEETTEMEFPEESENDEEEFVEEDERFSSEIEEDEEKDEEPEKVFDNDFKKKIKKENFKRKLYQLKNSIKHFLGLDGKLEGYNTITAFFDKLLGVLDFILNTVFILAVVCAVYLGILEIMKTFSDPLLIIAISIFIAVLSYVSEKIKG